MAENNRQLYLEPSLIFIVVLLLMKLGLASTFLRGTGLVIPVLFVWTPCLLVLVNRTNNEKLGLTGGEAFSSQIKTLAILFPLLGLYSLFHIYVLQTLVNFGSPVRSIETTIMGILSALVVECAYVALPEEFFFRGYLQGQIDEKRDGSLPIFFSAATFALAHVIVSGNLRRFEVFFPGLLFAWFRRRTKAIWVPILAHSACNVIFYLLLQRALSI